MTKRFKYGSNERWECVLIDTLEKKEYDFYEVGKLCNKLWEQTQRFEKHNKDLMEENEQLKKECYGNLDGLNYYQEQNGHLSSKISDLECENEQLKTTIQQLRTDNTKQKKKLNTAMKENEQLKSDLIDHSALISMLEDYQALKIEETLFNLTGAKSEEEFNELYKPYLDKAKRCWR